MRLQNASSPRKLHWVWEPSRSGWEEDTFSDEVVKYHQTISGKALVFVWWEQRWRAIFLRLDKERSRNVNQKSSTRSPHWRDRASLQTGEKKCLRWVLLFFYLKCFQKKIKCVERHQLRIETVKHKKRRIVKYLEPQSIIFASIAIELTLVKEHRTSFAEWSHSHHPGTKEHIS